MSLERESRSWRPKKLVITVGSRIGRVFGSATGIEAALRSMKKIKRGDKLAALAVPIEYSAAQIFLPLLRGHNISKQDGKVPIFGNSTKTLALKTLVDVGIDGAILATMLLNFDPTLMIGAKAIYNTGIAVLRQKEKVGQSKL